MDVPNPAIDLDRFRVRGDEFRLADVDPQATPGFDDGKKAAAPLIEANVKRIEALQEVLYAQGRERLLVVFQAMDAGGKDGTIRACFDGVNPQGVKVASFKKPTEPELARDYLWRIHAHVPARGEIAIFNRSHYEDVLVVRVHGWIDQAQCERRYRHIREFERMLVDEGATIRKFFLHILPDEQRERFQERLDEPTKRWKFSRADLDERAHWDGYMAAFQDMLRATSTDEAPWYVVPANRNWYRNLVVSTVVVDTLERLGLVYPEPEEGLDTIELT
ncbi:MAG: polyphosphate kinase 2 family protein [Acidimicrobiia bacterium]|nr:polyphosphate kinase 2 family protein [Acidimicrobiia bacterium]